MSVHKIAPDRSETDPQRAAQHEAMEAERRAKTAEASHRQAIRRTDDRLEQAREKLVAAEAEEAAAQEEQAQLIEDAAAKEGSSWPTDQRVRAAQKAAAEVRTDIKNLEIAASRLRERHPPFLDAIAEATIGKIKVANQEKIAAVGHLVLERLRAARAEAFLLEQVADVLAAQDDRMLPEVAGNPTRSLVLRQAAQQPLWELREKLDRIVSESRHLNTPAVQAWRQWRARAYDDPDLAPPAETP